MIKFDEIGPWSEVKLEILEEYAKPYSRILSAQRDPRLHHIYVDAFSGSGTHRSKATGAPILGSPMRALDIQPPFKEYYFIDLDRPKVDSLRSAIGDREGVHVLEGDCNQLLLSEVFPRIQWRNYRRGLCLLDPYGLHLDWRVIQAAAASRAIEIFLNFPVLDMNRNALWRERESVTPENRERMTKFWGDESWRDVAYAPARQQRLFGDPEYEKQGNETLAEAFRNRLREFAGFEYVPKPMAMRNSTNAVVYYLYFACHKPTAKKIVEDIFEKRR